MPCCLQICPVKSLLSISVNSKRDWSQSWLTSQCSLTCKPDYGEKRDGGTQKRRFKPASCPFLELRYGYRKHPDLGSLLLRNSTHCSLQIRKQIFYSKHFFITNQKEKKKKNSCRIKILKTFHLRDMKMFVIRFSVKEKFAFSAP